MVIRKVRRVESSAILLPNLFFSVFRSSFRLLFIIFATEITNLFKECIISVFDYVMDGNNGHIAKIKTYWQ